MTTLAVHQIEKEFAQLSREDQLIVLERLIHQVRMDVGTHAGSHDKSSPATGGDVELPLVVERIPARYSTPGADLLSEAW